MALLAVAAGGLTGCGQGSPSAAPRSAGSFTDGGVTASVTLERTATDQVRLTAELAPQTRGFHLYSLDLPDGGVDGLGIPTRLNVSAPLIPAGPVSASAKPYGLRLPELEVTLPVYPDGPVTLHLTARLADPRATSTRVLLSYGACSSTAGCRPPVRGHPLVLPVPRA
ncbi:hypothetical protein [Streptomyces sp. NPDC020917]|uniref:hypothetical protein n=1 Tax=Streptomyces sp. NPDC020917 TaxID=3365102 RepID=UPI0037B94212